LNLGIGRGDQPEHKESSMLASQKKLIHDTWAQLVPIADQAAAIFYQRLFEIDPSTRALFNTTDMAQQRKKLVQILSVAVSSLDNLGALGKTVEGLGSRHAGYGVKDAHYDSAGVALLWTLEQRLGAAWTPEAAAAWKQVYGLLSGIMRNAQQAASVKAAA
jgi:hemoglobin-like flavoprotein